MYVRFPARCPLSSFCLMSESPTAARRGQPVHVVHDLVRDRTGFDLARPTHHRRHPPAALPVRVFLASERRGGGVRPRVVVRSVVGRVKHDRVVGDAQLVQLVQQLTHMAVVLHHAVGVDVLPGNAPVLLLHMGAEVHPRTVPPHEERLAGLVLPLDEIQRCGDGLVVDRLHALPRQRAGVLDAPVGVGTDYAPRAETLAERRILRVVLVLRLLLGVQVVEVAEELVEAVGRR